jgi:hypothetical protein
MITPNQLIVLSKSPQFRLCGINFLSQNPNAVSAADRSHYVPLLLPQFVLLLNDIEKVTGHAWKVTSYIRDSPSHSKAQSIDFAPDVAPSAQKAYGVYKNSDPILHKRQKLYSQLSQLVHKRYDSANSIGIFVESDHLHVQALANEAGRAPVRIAKWGLRKPLYPDTDARNALPMLSGDAPLLNK